VVDLWYVLVQNFERGREEGRRERREEEGGGAAKATS
jgi:hypothetical protein